MKKLVFDIGITGHHSEYINHLIDYLGENNKKDNIYYFIVHPEFSTHFPEIVRKARLIHNINWLQINQRTYKISRKYGTVMSSFIEFYIANGYARRLKADHLYLLNFHSMKFAGMIWRPKYKISTILFHTFSRLKKDSLSDKFQYFKRYLILRFCCKNPNLSNVFILNDLQTVVSKNKTFNTNCFKMMPDPIPKLKASIKFDLYDYFGISKQRKIFLHIGSLGSIKGTMEVLKSALLLEKEHQKKVTFLLVGKARVTSDERLFLNLINSIRQQSEVEVSWHNKFVSNEIMKSTFNNCDCVLLPYKNTEFSSGILGHSAASGKPVIATGKGLIKELVTEYKLGQLLKEPKDIYIAKEIVSFLNKKDYRYNFAKFIEDRTPERFAEILFTD